MQHGIFALTLAIAVLGSISSLCPPPDGPTCHAPFPSDNYYCDLWKYLWHGQQAPSVAREVGALEV